MSGLVLERQMSLPNNLDISYYEYELTLQPPSVTFDCFQQVILLACNLSYHFLSRNLEYTSFEK